MNSDSLLLTVAVVSVIIVLASVGFTYNSISTFRNFLTGFATEEGHVQVEIISAAAINITSAGGEIGSKTINWGPGAVAAGSDFAILATNGTVENADPTYTWATINGGFVIQNIGNVNVTLSVTSINATNFIGGTSPLFQYNVTNTKPGSCTFESGIVESTYIDFSDIATSVCSSFSSNPDNDTINMDVLLRIPRDAPPGALDTTVTLTYEQA